MPVQLDRDRLAPRTGRESKESLASGALVPIQPRPIDARWLPFRGLSKVSCGTGPSAQLGLLLAASAERLRA